MTNADLFAKRVVQHAAVDNRRLSIHEFSASGTEVMRTWSAVIVVLWGVVGGHAWAANSDWRRGLAPESDGWKQVEQHFIFNNATEPETLDPGLITGVPEARLVDALFEGLLTVDPRTLEPRPGVAERWDVSANRMRYVFHLRKTARWSNGQLVTAADFLQSWKRVLTPSTGAEYAYQLYPISGAEDYHKGRLSDFAKVGIIVQDAHTLVVSLTSPCSYFPDLVAFHTLYPVPTVVVDKHGDRWVRPENIVSNGAFRLESWEPRQRIELVPNETYWGRDLVRLTRVTALPYDDLDTAYKLFQQGKLHWLPAVPLAKINEVKRNPDYYAAKYLGVYFYRFNVTRPPFNDARVRRALSMAIDRQVITEHVLKGGQQPTAAFCPPVAGYQPVEGLAYDRDAARALLHEAGYGPERPLPTVEVLYNTSESHKQVAEAIAQQWKINLGVSVTLRNSEWKVFLNELNTLNYQIARSSWIGDYRDPNTFFDMWITNGGNNRTGWSNARYDDLLRRSQLESDRERRVKLLQEMEQILVVDEAPVMPIYIYVNQGLLHESVGGWFENIRDMHPLKYLWLDAGFE